MEQDGPDAIERERIRAAMYRILSDPVFVRSPILSRLLDYLVAMTLERKSIKSYAIAFDALGKSNTDHNDADAHARVTVGRLRKALAAYHAANPDHDELTIDVGTYRVHLRTNSIGPAARPVEDTAKVRTPASPKPAWNRKWSILAFAVLLLPAASYAYLQHTRSEAAVWTNASFPRLGVKFEPLRDSVLIPRNTSALVQQELVATLDSYNGFQVVDFPDARSDFELRISVLPDRQDSVQSTVLIESGTGIVVWSKQHRLRSAMDVTSSVQPIVDAIARPNGALTSYLRRKGFDPGNPFGCWLEFTKAAQTLNTSTDPALKDCARRWYTVTPEGRLAAFLYSWTLVDAATLARSDAERAELIDQAEAVTNRSIVLDPAFALSRLSEMRIHALRGERQQLIQAANAALRVGERNRFIVGMAGGGLAMWNDPKGEEVLKALAKKPGEASPWELVGMFITAMMRDDLAAAEAPATELRKFNESQPLLLLIEAAYAQRSGDTIAAQAAMAKLRANPRIRLAGMDRVYARLPVAPEVTRKLRSWLQDQD